MGTLYPSTAISGYSANPPPDDGTQSDANKVKYSTLKEKLGDPLETAIEAINTALVAAFDYSVNQKTANYTTVAADHMRTVEIASTVSSGITISLGDAASLTNKYMVRVKNSSGLNQTIGRITGGDTIDGVAGNITLGAGQALLIGVNAAASGFLTLEAINYSPGNHSVTGTLSVEGDVSLSTGTGNKVVTLGGSPSSNDGSIINLLSSNSASNWRISHNLVVGGALEFTPSTATGGSTFTTPAASLTASAFSVPSGVKVRIDGVDALGDTYIHESAANVMSFVAGNSTCLQVRDGAIALIDGVTAPTATAGLAKVYIDTADGDLKIIYGDGTVKTITTDT